MLPESIKFAARELRKNMTPAEKLLWKEIEKEKVWKQFQKQKPIFVYEENSWWKRYIIADFVCLEEKLIIEIDGSIHNLPEVLQFDKHKEELLKARWYRVIRFRNEEIQTNMQEVLELIQNSFTYSSSESSPFTKKEKGYKTDF